MIDADTIKIMGAIGAVVSTVKMIAVEEAEILPAASVALAVMVWAAWVKAVVGVNVQEPVVESALAVPSTVDPS